MDVRSGCAGFSENVALHARSASSRQLTVTDSSARATLMGPGRTPLRSSGTDTAAAGRGIRIRAARKALRMAEHHFTTRTRRQPFGKTLMQGRSTRRTLSAARSAGHYVGPCAELSQET